MEAAEASAVEQELAPATEGQRAAHDVAGVEATDGHPGSEALEVGEAKDEVLDGVVKICDAEASGEGGLSSLEANRSAVNDVTVHDLPTGDLLAVGSVNLGDGDNGENQAEVVALAARMADTSCGIDFGAVNQDTVTEIGVLVHSVEGVHLKDSSMVCRSESIQGEDSTDAGEEKQEDEMMKSVDDGRIGPPAVIQDDSSLGGPVVQVKNSDSYASWNNQKEITDSDIRGSSIFTRVLIAEEEIADGHPEDLMNTGDFVNTDVGSANVVVHTEPKSSEIQPAKEVTMTKRDTSLIDLGSISGVLIAESQSRNSDTHLAVESPNDKAGVSLENLVFTKEGQDADVGLFDNSLLENRGFAVAAPIPATVASVPETSPLFEIQNLESQGKENLSSASGVLMAESQSGDVHLAAENPNHKSHIIQENPVLAKVVQDADAVSLDNTLVEKGGFNATDLDSVMDTSVPETSTSFEIPNLAFQGEENLGSVSGFLIRESQSGNTNLVAENPNRKYDIVLENTPLAKELQDANVGPIDDTLQEKKDFAATDSNPLLHTSEPKTSASFEISITASRGKEILGSISGALVAEPQIGDTHLVVENPDDEADIVQENLASLKEAVDSDVGPVENTLLDKGDFAVRDPNPVMDTSVPEASLPYEIPRPASQGKVSTDFSLGDSQITGAPSLGSLADDSWGVDVHKLEPSPGRSRTDMGPNVLNHTISPLNECYNEFEVVLPEAKQQTETLDDGVPEISTSAGISQIEEQESLECADDQTQDSVAATPWTSYVQNIERVRYYLPSQVSTELSISDLVWGKVKSHPWWPGEIVDPSNASEMALTHQKKDNFLVAYFGDRTFAWREKSQLKLFYTNFSQMEKQSSSDAFIYAVKDSLEEVSRRVELGLTCSCVPEENYAGIKYTKIENAGIREALGATTFNRSLIVNQLQPERLLEYISALAQSPTGGAHRLDLGIAQAQLKAFYRSKGYPELTKFTSCGWLIENDIESSFAGERKPVENLIVHPAPVPSELIPVKRKRGRPRKDQKVTLGSGGLIENTIVISSCKDRATAEYAVQYSTPTSSELIPVKRKRGRPPKNQQRILEDIGKQKNLYELMEDKNLSRVKSGSGRSGLKDARTSGSGSSDKRSKFDHPNFADTGKRKRKKLDLLQGIETSTSPLALNHSFESGEGLDGSWKSKKESKDSSGDFQAKPPSSRVSSSFKIGEYIQRFASKLTGSSPILRCHGETFPKSASLSDCSKADIHIDEFPCSPVWNRRKKKGVAENYSSLDEVLSQLCLAATDPLKGYGFVSSIVSFFTKFRNSIASDMSKPDYMKDSYWSDVISDNISERRLLPNGLKRKRGANMKKQRKGRKPEGLLPPSLLLASVTDTAHQLQFGALNMKLASGAERSIILVEEKIIDTPTALVLSFNSSHSLPSETDLIRVFSRYGPLKEEETEILKKSNRVKVVFKRRADAEIAFSSAGKFSIFGPALLSYRLRYLTSISKTSPDASPDGKCDALHTENGILEVSAPKGFLDVSLLGNEDAAPAENGTPASGYFQSQGNDDAVPAEDVKLDSSVPLTTPDISSEVKNDALTMEGGDVGVFETGEFDTAEVEAIGQG